jgi:hypothetical protein
MKTVKGSPQWRVYSFVCQYVADTNGRFPTNRVISAMTGINSTSTVGRYLEQLADDGLLQPRRVGRTLQRRYTIAGQRVILPPDAASAAREWPILKQVSR